MTFSNNSEHVFRHKSIPNRLIDNFSFSTGVELFKLLYFPFRRQLPIFESEEKKAFSAPHASMHTANDETKRRQFAACVLLMSLPVMFIGINDVRVSLKGHLNYHLFVAMPIKVEGFMCYVLWDRNVRKLQVLSMIFHLEHPTHPHKKSRKKNVFSYQVKQILVNNRFF